MDYALIPSDDGVHVFTGAAILVSAGLQVLTATDALNPAVIGTSNVIAVGPGVVSRFILTAPASTIAGSPFVLQVTAVDQFNNRVTNYTGTVAFTSSDAQALCPAASTLTAGFGAFVAVTRTAGNQTLTVTDSVASNITATTAAINVSAGPAAYFTLAPAATTLTAGDGDLITVTAFDAFNNKATAYAGSIHFSSTDPFATLPGNATLTNGVGNVGVTLKTAGVQTVTATDSLTSTITGTESATVVGKAATHFVVSGLSLSVVAGVAATFTVTAEDQFNNTANSYTGAVHFTSSDTAGKLPADATLTNGVGIFGVSLFSLVLKR